MASHPPVEQRHLAVRNLHLWRGDKHLLRGVSFELRLVRLPSEQKMLSA